jgi:hypothetical protein
MGQFTTRPEEPTEWAGLPSEPAESRPANESLAVPVESADSLTFLSGAIESIVIPVVPVDEIAASATDVGGGDPRPRDEA